MTRRGRLLAALGLVLGVAAASGSAWWGSRSEAMDPETAARMAWKITANPAATERILKRHGVSRQEYETALFQIAMDESRSQAYETALLAAEQAWFRGAGRMQTQQGPR